MDMIEKVIITVKLGDSIIQFDIEIPVDMQGKQIIYQISDIMKSLHPDIELDPNKCKLMIDSIGKYLDDESTLEEIGIWEGSILTIVYK